MVRCLQHPEIDWIERTGYPSYMQDYDCDDDDEDEDDEWSAQDAYEAYCDACYEEARDRQLFY